MGGSEGPAAEHLYAHPEGLASVGAGAVEHIEGFTRAEGDAYEADLRGKYDWEAIAATRPAPLLVESAEDDLAALLSASLRAHFGLTGSNLYALATRLIDGGVRSVEHFEALRLDYVSGLGLSSADEARIAEFKQEKETEQEQAAEEESKLSPAQEKMLEEAYDRKDGGVRFQVRHPTQRELHGTAAAPHPHMACACSPRSAAVPYPCADAVAPRAQPGWRADQRTGQGMARAGPRQPTCRGPGARTGRKDGHAERQVRRSEARREVKAGAGAGPAAGARASGGAGAGARAGSGAGGAEGGRS